MVKTVAQSFNNRRALMEKRRSSIIHSQPQKAGTGRGPSRPSDKGSTRGAEPETGGGLLDPFLFNSWDDKLKMASLTLALKVIPRTMTLWKCKLCFLLTEFPQPNQGVPLHPLEPLLLLTLQNH